MGQLRDWGIVIVGIVFLATANVALGGSTQFAWNSPTTGNWTNPTKWSPNGVPGIEETDEVYIGRGAGSGGTAILDSAVPAINRFNIGEGGTGTLDVRAGASLVTNTTVSADAIGLNGRGSLLMSGGMITLGRRLIVNDGTLDISGGTFAMPDTLNGDLSLGISAFGDLTVRGTGRLDVGRDLKIGDGGAGRFTLRGGQATVTRNLIVGAPFGLGELSIAGGELSVGGSLIVGGPIGEGTLKLQSSSAQVVAGAFDVSSDGTVILDLGATLSPIRATTSSLAGDLSVVLNASPSVGTVYPLVQVASTGIHATTFDSKPEGAVFLIDDPSGGIPVRISYRANLDGGSLGNDVTLTVLPTVVNRADVAVMVSNWHGTGGLEQGDFDGNGIVNLLDLMALQRSIGGAPASAVAVPEPAAWASMLAALAVVAVFSRLGLAGGTNRR